MNKRQKKKYWEREYRRWKLTKPHTMAHFHRSFIQRYKSLTFPVHSYPFLALVPKFAIIGEELHTVLEVPSEN